jgi:hypothetical protein
MDGMQIALPVLGIVAAAAVTFYAVSFNELREVIKQHHQLYMHALFINLINCVIKLNYDRNHFKIGMNLNQKMEITDDYPARLERGELEDKLRKITKPINYYHLSINFNLLPFISLFLCLVIMNYTALYFCCHIATKCKGFRLIQLIE